jgi:hypothetical protein
MLWPDSRGSVAKISFITAVRWTSQALPVRRVSSPTLSPGRAAAMRLSPGRAAAMRSRVSLTSARSSRESGRKLLATLRKSASSRKPGPEDTPVSR